MRGESGAEGAREPAAFGMSGRTTAVSRSILDQTSSEC